jgi:hypothetical protein
MTHFSFNVYPARGHAVGSGGNGEQRGSGKARVFATDAGDDRLTLRPIEPQTVRSRFVDEVLAKIKARSLQTPNPGDPQAAVETPEEHQIKKRNQGRRAA